MLLSTSRGAYSFTLSQHVSTFHHADLRQGVAKVRGSCIFRHIFPSVIPLHTASYAINWRLPRSEGSRGTALMDLAVSRLLAAYDTFIERHALC